MVLSRTNPGDFPARSTACGSGDNETVNYIQFDFSLYSMREFCRLMLTRDGDGDTAMGEIRCRLGLR